MRCEYFEAGACRSCPHLALPTTYAEQLAAKDAAVRAAVGKRDGLTWEAPHPSPEERFRTKAKMVVGGTREAPTFGILDGAGQGVDLRGCHLLGPALTAALPVVAEHVAAIGLTPYDVSRRSGELKHVHLVENSDGELMLRFVLRSEGQLGKLRRGLPALREALTAIGVPARVVTANLLPEHKATTEGDTEIPLTEETSLPVRAGDVTLYVEPGAFLQTNAPVAAALYREAAAWIDRTQPAAVLDLYCGAGGFALHAAKPGRPVTGVEVSEAAVASARRSAAESGRGAEFVVGDAVAYARELPALPELVVVNPPRRGIGTELARWLDASNAGTVLYSSCNPATLARDLDAMNSLRPVRARLFDMFPHTDHSEVLTLLSRG